MFTTDPGVQRARFAAELDGDRPFDPVASTTFAPTAAALGARHRGYGVRAAHYRLMGEALLAALAAALGDGWTDEVAEAWALAYNLTAETMMMGPWRSPSALSSVSPPSAPASCRRPPTPSFV